MSNSRSLGARGGRSPALALQAWGGGGDDPRARLMGAMIATVAYRGFERTTVERVRQVAEVPAAVFEEHFRDKEDCFVEALDGLLARVHAGVDDAVGPRGLPWATRVRAGLRALLAALAADPDGARVLLVECLRAGPRAYARHERLLAPLLVLLEEGRFHCADPAHLPASTAEGIAGGVGAIVQRRALEDRTGELPRLLGDIAYFVLLPYLGHHRALLAAHPRPLAA